MRFTHQPGAQPLAGYTIQRGIHRGGFGEVYYARSDGGKEVALKLLQREQDVELRGVRQCLNLKHANLVNLFDVRTDSEGEQWVVMEYVNGTSLEDVLAAFPNGLPIGEVQEWLCGIVAGVTYLHDRGIVHRDLKPGNVYRENGIVKVGDVGLSKRLGSDRRAAHTQSVGTVYYMAPEVANGQYGPEVDVYSLGIMLYEMLTGRLPFTGETTAEVLMKHLTATARLDCLPTSIRPVVARALAKDPKLRTPSALQLESEFLVALDSLKQGSHDSADWNAMVASSGTAVANVRVRMTETPATSATNVNTRYAGAMINRPPLPTRTSAQAASAYAQYPPEETRPEKLESAAPVSVAPKSKPKPDRPAPVQAPPAVPPAPASLNWPLVAAVLVALMLFSPGTWQSWAGIGLMGSALTATAALRGRHGRGLDTSLISVDPSVDVQVCTRTSDSREAVGDAAAALTVGSVGASLMSVGTLLASGFFQKASHAPSADTICFFTVMSVAATWLILSAGQLGRYSKWLQKNPRKSFLFVGLLLGGLAWGLDQYLLVDYGNYVSGGSAAVRSIGVHRLTDADLSPSWLGYLVFFGGLLSLHRWWQELSPKRNRQLSVGRMASAAVVAWIMTVIFAFPQWPAIMWALSISAAVQLASPWPERNQARRAS